MGHNQKYTINDKPDFFRSQICDILSGKTKPDNAVVSKEEQPMSLTEQKLFKMYTPDKISEIKDKLLGDFIAEKHPHLLDRENQWEKTLLKVLDILPKIFLYKERQAGVSRFLLKHVLGQPRGKFLFITPSISHFQDQLALLTKSMGIELKETDVLNLLRTDYGLSIEFISSNNMVKLDLGIRGKRYDMVVFDEISNNAQVAILPNLTEFTKNLIITHSYKEDMSYRGIDEIALFLDSLQLAPLHKIYLSSLN
jgi:hypothetical protein